MTVVEEEEFAQGHNGSTEQTDARRVQNVPKEGKKMKHSWLETSQRWVRAEAVKDLYQHQP